jgi:hypothetical protein
MSLGQIAQKMIEARDRLPIGATSITGIAGQYRKLYRSGVDFSYHNPSTVDEAVLNLLDAVAWLFVAASKAGVADDQFSDPFTSGGSLWGAIDSGTMASGMSVAMELKEAEITAATHKLKTDKVKEVYSEFAARVSANIDLLNRRWAAVAAANHNLKRMMKR